MMSFWQMETSTLATNIEEVLGTNVQNVSAENSKVNCFSLQESIYMCHKCLDKVLPDRGSTCLDGGSYFLNFKQCVNCNKKQNIHIKNKISHEDDDGVETVKYEHICESCGHLIATHEYTFQVEDGYQEYEMNCKLCGFAQDRISVMPVDQEKMRGEF